MGFKPGDSGRVPLVDAAAEFRAACLDLWETFVDEVGLRRLVIWLDRRLG